MTFLHRLMTDSLLRAPEDGGAAAAASGGDAAKPNESVLFGGDAAKPEDVAAEGKPEGGDDVAKAAAADARAKELEAMSPEDRAKAEAEDKAKADEAWATAVPADGKYAPKMPDGVTIDQAMLDALAPDFAEAKLTNGQVQKLTEKYIERQTAETKARAEAWSKQLGDWVTEAKADAEIGGAKWDTSVRLAKSAIDRFGTPALKEYLEASGGGNNPELIRFAARAGAAIAEDNPPVGGAVKPNVGVEQTLFPNDAKGA